MKINRLQSLAARLSLWIVSLGTLIFIAVLGANYYKSLSLLKDDVEDLTKEKAISTVREIEAVFSAAATSADTLSSIVSTSDTSAAQIHKTIKAFINTNQSIFGMTVALEPLSLLKNQGDYSPYYYGKKNELAFSDLAKDNYNYKSKSWYSKPKELNKPVWSKAYFDEGGGDVWMITYSTPIYLTGGKTFAGIATADINLEFLDALIKKAKIGKLGTAFIVTSDDTIIARSNSTAKLSRSTKLARLTEATVDPSRWQHYKDSKKGSVTYPFTDTCPKNENQNKEIDTGTCRYTIKALNNDWKVIIILPEKELSARINELTTEIATIAAIGLMILLLTITFITRYLTKPLGRLAKATKDIGAGHLDTEIPDPVREDEIGALTDDFSSMRKALKVYIGEVKEATAKQQKLESEIQIAKDIQMSMIPGSGKAVIKNDAYQLFALLRPARSVGGDLYYFKQLDCTLHFILGDVSDKGVPAALFMAKTVTLYTRALRDDLSPGKTLTMMNDILSQNNDACMFVTALCGHIDLNTGTVVMSNAGHMDPIIQDTQGTREQEVNGATALGLMEGVDYPDVTFQLDHKTSMIMYTDGISEAHDIDSNQYSDEKLIDLITGIDTSSSEKTGTTIIQSVDDFAGDTEQFDDITIMIIRYE
ncbi:MAG: hypothetical protein DRQ44_14090 [Gammaproteobacteria bacterium]|nr:MAG: hypothetical protein DRQ44_14090 [Gammaproteobacteria bacterium]